MDPMMKVVEIDAKDTLTFVPMSSRRVQQQDAAGTWNKNSNFAPDIPNAKSDKNGKQRPNKNTRRKKNKKGLEENEVSKVHELIKKMQENQSGNGDPVSGAATVPEVQPNTNMVPITTVPSNSNNNAGILAPTTGDGTIGSFFASNKNIAYVTGGAVLAFVVVVSVITVRICVVKKRRRKIQARKEAMIAQAITVQDKSAKSKGIAKIIESNNKLTTDQSSFSSSYYEDDVDKLKRTIMNIMEEG